MQTKRELAFLNYLDALEKGDAEGVSAFLELAEADAELEKMMMDYHNEENEERPIESPKLITPMKRKREDVNRWWRRFGNGLVAAILMAIVGLAGMIIGSRGGNTQDADALRQSLNPTQDLNVLTTPNSPAAFNVFCEALITSEDNTVHLLAGGDIDKEMTVGVNNPFLLMLNDGRESAGYNALFQGLSVVVDKASIQLDSRCERLRSIQVLPKHASNVNCEVTLEAVDLPMRNLQSGTGLFSVFSLDQHLLLIDKPENGVYPISSLDFTGTVPEEFVTLSYDCMSFPILFVPRLPNPNSYGTRVTDLIPVIDVDSLKITEQRFERGVFFYIEAVQQLWIVFDYEDERDAWYVSSLSPESNIPVSQIGAVPENFIIPQEGLFEFTWSWTGFGDKGLVRDEIGWAISEPLTYDAAYHFDRLAGGRFVHVIQSSTGDFYSLYEAGSRWAINDGR